MLNFFRKKTAIRQGGIVLLDQGALSIANFVTGVLVARSCSKEEYGVYILAWSIIMIVQSAHKGFANLPFTIYAPRMSADEQSSYFGSMLVHTFIIIVMITAILFFVYLWFGSSESNGSADFYSIIPALCVLIASYMYREFIRSVLLAKLLVTQSLVPNFIATSLQVIIVSFLFINETLTLQGAIVILALSNAIASLIMLYNQRHTWEVGRLNIWPDFVKSSRIGRWELANSITYMAGYQLYPWLILPILGQNDVAAFGVCMAIANLPAPFLRGASAYILPRMSHGFKDGDHQSLNRILKYSVLAILIPYGLWFIVGSLFGESITVLFYSDKYSGYAALLFWMLLRSMIESATTPLTQALQTLEKIHINTISGAIGAVVTIALAPLAIHQMGVVGAGIVGVLVAIIRLLYRWVAIKKIMNNG